MSGVGTSPKKVQLFMLYVAAEHLNDKIDGANTEHQMQWHVMHKLTLSTLMTEAPKSFRISPQNGAGASPAISTTLIPFRGIIAAVCLKKRKCSR